MSKLPKIIAVLGPTASGKTDLGIFLAKKFNGEVVSFDSRQIYKNMDIGTAKPRRDPTPALPFLKREGEYVVDGVVHHLMDFVELWQNYSLADFKADAVAAIDNVLSRGKLPILVGGTGLYFWAVIDNLEIPIVAPDKKLRAELEKMSLTELVQMLKAKDSVSAGIIDLKNPRRVLRALEVALSGESFIKQRQKGKPMYDVLQIGLQWPREELNARIDRRVDGQVESGLVGETEKLVGMLEDRDPDFHRDDSESDPSSARASVGMTSESIWALPSMSGIGYRQIGYFLRGEMALLEAIETLKHDTRHYAKRQMTWFKRDKRINWVEKDSKKMAEELVINFLK